MRRHLSIFVAFIALLATGFAMLATSTPAIAEDYQYTIRVFPGNRGMLPSDPVVVTVPKGGDIDLYQVATADITDAKYVQTGFRMSGQDTLYGNGRVNGVTEDMDFVIAYGVEADVVAYTLQFVEYGTGRELAEPKTYYGKDGDKPVAAYEHIAGYRPRYLAITGTLHKDEENVWTFEYVPLGNGETIVTTTTTNETTYTIVPSAPQASDADGGAATDGGNGNAGGDTTTTAGGANQDGNNAGTADGTQGDAENGTQEESKPETREILDLDTPLANPSSDKGNLRSDATILGHPALIAAGCLGALIAAGVFFVIWRRKAKQHEEA